MRKIVFTNDKGGVGKTMTVANVAVGLASRGNSILVADMDGQGDVTKTILGTRPPLIGSQNKVPPSMYHLIVEEAEFDQVKISSPRYKNLDILPANLDLHRRAPMQLANTIGGNNMLLRIFNGLNPRRYDYVLIDTGKGLDLLVINSLVASDEVVILTRPGARDLEAVGRTKEYVDEVRVKTLQGADRPHVIGILLTHAETRGDKDAVTNTSSSREYLRANFPGLLFKTEIPDSKDYGKAAGRSLSIFEFTAKQRKTNKGKYTVRGQRAALPYDTFIEELTHHAR